MLFLPQPIRVVQCGFSWPCGHGWVGTSDAARTGRPHRRVADRIGVKVRLFLLPSLASSGILRLMDNATPNRQQILDAEHLRLLSIFHYVKGGISAFFACIPIIHLVIGLVMVVAPHAFGHGRDQPPAFLGWLFIIIALFVMVLGWTFAALTVMAGRCIARRRHYTFCLIVACLECLSIPLGTVLGVFTILVLNRASVKALFNPRPAM